MQPLAEVDDAAAVRDETEIVITVARLFDLVLEEVLEFFSDPRACGIVLSQGEARHIAGGIVQRAAQDHHTKGSREGEI